VAGRHHPRPVAALGRLADFERLALMRHSPRKRAVSRGLVLRRVIAGMGHNGRQGLFWSQGRDAVVEQVISALESGCGRGGSAGARWRPEPGAMPQPGRGSRPRATLAESASWVARALVLAS
jgi:hypothetical protein